MTSPDESSALLADAIRTSRRVVAFTGAGISTESGVPDFRSPGSPWQKHRPIDFAEFMASDEARVEAWRRKFAMDDIYAGAQPSRGHRALEALVRKGRVEIIVTQNIDGLHQASGVEPDRVVELHGNGTFAHCLDCGDRHELAEIRRFFQRTGQAPSCECGGIVKSATISFGQAMPERAMRRAREATMSCDLFIAIGSSLVVHPAATLPMIAKERGADLVILNKEPTPLDTIADIVLRGDIGDVLEPTVRLVDSA